MSAPAVPVPPAAASPARQDATNLDLLRAIAVLAVLVDHLMEYVAERIGVDPHPYDWWLGRLGVLLFFVHTSYVLMLSLERLQGERGSLFGRFMIRRVFRIYPLSLLAVVIVVLCRVPTMGWTPAFEMPTRGTVLANLALAQNLTYSPDVLAPLWSLPLEVQMYVVLPLLFVLVRGSSSVRRVVALWTLAVVIGVLQPHLVGRLTLAQYGPCFLGGVVAYVLGRQTRPHWRSAAWPVALAAVMLAYFAGAAATREVHPRAVGWIVCLTLGVLIPQFHDLRQPVLQRIVHLIARYSYGIYLSHIVLMWLVFAKLPPLSPWLQGALLAMLLVVVPALLYHLIEAPCLRVGARVARRIPDFSPVPLLALLRRQADSVVLRHSR